MLILILIQLTLIVTSAAQSKENSTMGGTGAENLTGIHGNSSNLHDDSYTDVNRLSPEQSGGVDYFADIYLAMFVFAVAVVIFGLVTIVSGYHVFMKSDVLVLCKRFWNAPPPEQTYSLSPFFGRMKFTLNRQGQIYTPSV